MNRDELGDDRRAVSFRQRAILDDNRRALWRRGVKHFVSDLDPATLVVSVDDLEKRRPRRSIKKIGEKSAKTH